MVLRLDPDDDEAERNERMGLERRTELEVRRELARVAGELFPPGSDPSNAYAEAVRAGSAVTGERMRDILSRALQDSADLGVSVAVRQFENVGYGFDYTLANENARNWALRYTDDVLAQLGTTTSRIVGQAVGRWVDNGEPLERLVRDIAPAFGRQRAKLIAATEITRAYAEGSKEAYIASGVVKKLVWQASMDERVCIYCGGLHGKVVGIEESFDSALPSALRERARPFAMPPAHPGCRCWILPEIQEVKPTRERKPKPTTVTPTPAPTPAMVPIPAAPAVEERRQRAEAMAAEARAGAERLAIEEQQRQAVAPALPAVPQPKENVIERVEAKLDTAIQRLANRYKTTPAEVEATVAKAAADLTDPSKPVSLRAPSGAIDAILDSGRFKSQFETGTSGAVLDKDLRARAEERGLGVAYDSAPDQRPIYGYVANPQFDRYLKEYGDLAVEFKPEIRKRTTVLMGDSLTPMNAGDGVPSPIDNLRKSSWDGNITSLYETAKGYEEWVMTGMEYVEVQIHGQAKVGDIARIRDTESKLTVTQLQRLRGLGIDVVDKDGLGRN